MKIIAKITNFGRSPAGLRPDFMSGPGLGPAVLTGPGVRCRTQTWTQSPAGLKKPQSGSSLFISRYPSIHR